MRNKVKKELTLRQKVLLAMAILCLVCLAVSIVLSLLERDTLTDITITLLGMFDAAFIAYMAADSADHNSENKYGRYKDKDGEETEGDE